ncbi:hypothetical protein [Massilia sp. Mn16-1_5]|uniref:hypothetical protein n=1 Tax=Massilia sp. Mn16-1_5 TaxID=2079199 RepID=UPI00109E4C2A|nr:hypothetical protein [Massilia sp. Mn16-1_5]THC43170.1 hypothetical protein C2862_13055 [Massilia sp. Mn16-1_5]
MTLKTLIAASLLAFNLAHAAEPLPMSVAVQGNPLGASPACGTGAADPASAAPDTLVRALYEIVSGPAGGRKDWDRMTTLFAPGAIVTPTTHRGEQFLAVPQSQSQFAALNDRLLGQRGFYEREVAQQIASFGHVAHVWSTYETRDRPDGPVRVRGVNAVQLLNDGKRWCILSITWDAELPAHPIPAALDRPGR